MYVTVKLKLTPDTEVPRDERMPKDEVAETLEGELSSISIDGWTVEVEEVEQK